MTSGVGYGSEAFAKVDEPRHLEAQNLR
jgi:hypothetical protein